MKSKVRNSLLVFLSLVFVISGAVLCFGAVANNPASSVIANPAYVPYANRGESIPILLFDLDLSTGTPHDNVTEAVIACTRSTKAWALDDSGVLQEFAVNTPVLEYIDSAWWLRAEPQSTNLVIESVDFSTPTYDYNDITLVSTNNTAPDGTSTATLFRGIGASSFGYLDSAITVTPGEVYTVSVYAKNVDATASRLTIYDVDHSNSIDNPDIISSINTDTFTRYSYQFTVPGGCTSILVFHTDETDGDIILWGLMLEHQLILTSYIPTAGSATTRNADVLTWTLSAAQIASLSDTGQATTKVLYPAITASMGAAGIFAPSDAITGPLYMSSSEALISAYDGTNTSAGATSIVADTDYVGSCQWSDAGLRGGVAASWQTLESFDGAFAQDGTGRFFHTPLVPSYMQNFEWWDTLVDGTPADGLVE